MSDKSPDYQSYLKIPQLLDLQDGLGLDPCTPLPGLDQVQVAPTDYRGNEERLFITVHQVFELWFKMVLGELEAFLRTLGPPTDNYLVPEDRMQWLVGRLRRAVEIMKIAIRHFDLMETLAPIDFLAFRDKLVPASGFQSVQIRKIEILLGLPIKGRKVLREGRELETFLLPEDRAAIALVEELVSRYGDIRSSVMAWLSRTPVDFTSASWQELHPDGLKPWDDNSRELGSRRREANLHWLRAQLDATRRQQADVEGRTHQDRLPMTQGAHQGFLSAKIRYLSGLETEGELAHETGPTREVSGLDGSLLLTRRSQEDAQHLSQVRGALLFIQSFPEVPLLSWPNALIDELIALEEHLLMWRNRHARMVERVIGRRPGTGGSEGVGYLDKTQLLRIFDELWASRTFLVDVRHLVVKDNAGGERPFLRDHEGFYSTLTLRRG